MLREIYFSFIHSAVGCLSSCVPRHANDGLTDISCLVSAALPWHKRKREDGLTIIGRVWLVAKGWSWNKGNVKERKLKTVLSFPGI